MGGKRPKRDVQPAPEAVGFDRLLRYFLGLGSWGFGGPIATVGYMQRDLVEQRRWLGERDFLNGVALGQTMPGPLAAQVVMWVGYLRRKALGALATSVAFILPSLALVLVVAYFYARYRGLAWVHSVFYGVAPAVIGIIALAALKLARLTDGRDLRLWAISAATLTVTAVTGAEIAFLFVGAGLLMLLWEAPPRWLGGRSANLIAVAGPGVWLGGATSGTLVPLGLFFLKAGAFIFGSGLAIVPFLREGVVSQHHWLTSRQFLDAVAIGLITPGPVVISAAFIGYLVAGLAGAAVATVAIFLPIYLGVVIPGGWFVRHSDNPQLKAFVRGATAAAAGAIGGATIVLGKQAIVDWQTAVFAVTALGLLLVLKFRAKEPLVVVAAAVAGLLIAR